MDENTLKESVATLLKNGDKAALAQLMVEWIQPQHITTDYISLLMNSKALNKGDSLVKKIRKGLKVHTFVPGSIHLAHEITVTERMNYILDGADIKVTANLWELEGGDIGTVGEIRTEMQAKLRDYYLAKVIAGLGTIWSAQNTPNNFTNVGGTLTAVALKNAIDTINQTTGGVKAVVGLRSDLTPITTFGAGWSDGTSTQLQVVPENIREIMQTGWLGRYYGAPIIALQQVYDNPDDYNALLPQGRILVIGNNIGDFVTYGEVKSKEYSDMRPTPPQWYLELLRIKFINIIKSLFRTLNFA